MAGEIQSSPRVIPLDPNKPVGFGLNERQEGVLKHFRMGVLDFLDEIPSALTGDARRLGCCLVPTRLTDGTDGKNIPVTFNTALVFRSEIKPPTMADLTLVNTWGSLLSAVVTFDTSLLTPNGQEVALDYYPLFIDLMHARGSACLLVVPELNGMAEGTPMQYHSEVIKELTTPSALSDRLVIEANLPPARVRDLWELDALSYTSVKNLIRHALDRMPATHKPSLGVDMGDAVSLEDNPWIHYGKPNSARQDTPTRMRFPLAFCHVIQEVGCADVKPQVDVYAQEGLFEQRGILHFRPRATYTPFGKNRQPYPTPIPDLSLGVTFGPHGSTMKLDGNTLNNSVIMGIGERPVIGGAVSVGVNPDNPDVWNSLVFGYNQQSGTVMITTAPIPAEYL